MPQKLRAAWTLLLTRAMGYGKERPRRTRTAPGWRLCRASWSAGRGCTCPGEAASTLAPTRTRSYVECVSGELRRPKAMGLGRGRNSRDEVELRMKGRVDFGPYALLGLRPRTPQEGLKGARPGAVRGVVADGARLPLPPRGRLDVAPNADMGLRPRTSPEGLNGARPGEGVGVGPGGLPANGLSLSLKQPFGEAAGPIREFRRQLNDRRRDGESLMDLGDP
jgi:hypothetical protein